MIQTNVSSKSILAKLLASEDITVIHGADAPTASFDVKNRVLTLPCWTNMSNSLYDMLVGHEVSHALYTPNSDSDGWFQIEALAKSLDMPASTVKMYANIVEDARIERMIKSKFPGLPPRLHRLLSGSHGARSLRDCRHRHCRPPAD